MALNFPLDPTGYTAAHGWRPLRLRETWQRGWDVFDLQCKLEFLNFEIDRDGVFGPRTHAIVEAFQELVAPEAGIIDGIAGARTQVTLGTRVCASGPLPLRIHGQMERETSLLCGIYTAKYTNGSQDRGPLQENSVYWPDLQAAFNVRKCVPDLVKRIIDNAARYQGWGVDADRAWAAAQGHWNSPLNADRYARGMTVTTAFQEYVDAVTAYVRG